MPIKWPFRIWHHSKSILSSKPMSWRDHAWFGPMGEALCVGDHHIILDYIIRYLCEKTNPPMTKNPAGCRPPNLPWALFADGGNAINILKNMIHVPLSVSLITEEPAWWLLMAWRLFGARTSASIMVTDAGRCVSESPSLMSRSELMVHACPSDSKVHGVNMGPIWGQQDPGGPHVGPMNFDIWGCGAMR